MHVQHVEVLALQTHDDAHGLRVEVDQVAPLELAERVHAAGHVGAELQVLGQDLHLVHGQVGDQHHAVVFDAHDQAGIALVAT